MNIFEKMPAAPPEFESADFKPRIEQLPDGGKKYTIRFKRPPVFSRRVKSAQEMLDQTKAQVELGLDQPAHFKDKIDYKKMLPVIGSPESIPMPSPKLEVAMVRHLKHKDNVVPGEERNAFLPRIEELLKDLEITEHSKVFLITSSVSEFDVTSGQLEIRSRTEDTAKAIGEVLTERGIRYSYNNIDNSDEGFGGTTLKVRDGLREFEEDSRLFGEAIGKFLANIAAKKEGRELPYPDSAYSMPPSAYASEAPDLKDLMEKTGVKEMSSATVARGLSAMDALEFHFLEQDQYLGEAVDKVVVLMVGHGQFMTDLSEAVQVATDKKFPILFANNGAYWRINAAKDANGEFVEEWIVEESKRTGMRAI
jgi:hypothetical protein